MDVLRILRMLWNHVVKATSLTERAEAEMLFLSEVCNLGAEVAAQPPKQKGLQIGG